MSGIKNNYCVPMHALSVFEEGDLGFRIRFYKSTLGVKNCDIVFLKL